LKKGATDFHVVAEDETLANISQKEGVRLESLLEYNKISKEKNLKVGDKINLRAPTTTNTTNVKNRNNYPCQSSTYTTNLSSPIYLRH